MVSKFKQFRYYGSNSSQNNISKAQLISGNLFTQEIKKITQLGIRALPGTKFYINNNINPIIIGFLGVFELDFNNKEGSITDLKFDSLSVNAIDDNLSGGYIIIDLLGVGGD